MTEEEKKVKYQYIVYQLSLINNKVENLNNSISILKNTIGKSLIINNIGIEEDTIDNIATNLKAVSSNIKGTIIPILNNKIYS